MKIDLKNSQIKSIILAVENINQLIEVDESLQLLTAFKVLVVQNDENGYELLKLHCENNLSDEKLNEYTDAIAKTSTPEVAKILTEDTRINSVILDLKKLQLNYEILRSRKIPAVNLFINESYYEYMDLKKEKYPHIKTRILRMKTMKYKTVLGINQNNKR